MRPPAYLSDTKTQTDMSELQRLYDLDRSFSRDLDKLLHDEGYVDGLLQLPENELIPLVNYLNDVGSPL